MKKSFIKRNRIYKLWKSDKLNSLKKVNFLNQLQKVEKLIRIAKKDHYYQKFNKCIGDSRQVFKVLNEINGKTAKSSKISAFSARLCFRPSLVYINDIQHAVCNSNVFLFADDTNISCQKSIYEEYQLDLTKILPGLVQIN